MLKLAEPLRLGLLGFAQAVMAARPPDFTVGEGYMARWRLAEYGDASNCYIYRFTGDDEDSALHNHPYDNVSAILSNDYYEHLHTDPLAVEGDRYKTFRLMRRQGDIVSRTAATYHRLEMVNAKPVISLFTTGPRIQPIWGFLCVSGFVPFKEFLTENGGRKGCP